MTPMYECAVGSKACVAAHCVATQQLLNSVFAEGWTLPLPCACAGAAPLPLRQRHDLRGGGAHRGGAGGSGQDPLKLRALKISKTVLTPSRPWSHPVKHYAHFDSSDSSCLRAVLHSVHVGVTSTSRGPIRWSVLVGCLHPSGPLAAVQDSVHTHASTHCVPHSTCTQHLFSRPCPPRALPGAPE